MKKSNIKVYIWFVAVITIGLWAIVLWVSGIELKGSVAALKKLPVVITIEAGLWALFAQWMWKWKIFQSWFVIEPIIQGTWKGSLKTTWINPETGESPEPIPVVVSIKQSFFHIACTVFTEESTSTSYAAKIYIEEGAGTIHFVYSYTNKPNASVRERSQFHDGTANLRIVGESQARMEGDYWTTRKSTGDLELEFVTKKLANSFKGQVGAIGGVTLCYFNI